jgi:hypothetical protein
VNFINNDIILLSYYEGGVLSSAYFSEAETGTVGAVLIKKGMVILIFYIP